MKTRIVIVGGFLGAGKTTLLLAAAERLAARGFRVALITNDQGRELVDTAMGRRAVIPVAEVAGGCFCCRFPDLIARFDDLRRTDAPQIILAEPVGSCTDLVATVIRPLVQFYGDQYELAPLTVLLDPGRGQAGFSEDVRYLYQQQPAEAELLLLSKSDLYQADDEAERVGAYQQEYPHARVFPVSAVTGAGLDRWIEHLLGEQSADPEALVIDYERYAEAEAALGWLNLKGIIRANRHYSLHGWMETLMTTLRNRCAAEEIAIAHIKALATASLGEMERAEPATGPLQIKANLVGTGADIAWDSGHDGQGMDSGPGNDGGAAILGHDFLLNVRVHAAPERMESLVLAAVEASKPDPGARTYLDQFECFRPLPPEPHVRLTR